MPKYSQRCSIDSDNSNTKRMNFIISALFWVIFLLPMLVNGQQNCNILLKETIKQVSCSGGMDGAIGLQARGGVAPYTYHWSNGEEVKEINGLGEGLYTVTVRDREGCSATAQFKIIPDNEASLALKVVQKPSVGKQQVLQVTFENGQKPYAVTIKKISEGFRAPVVAYTGESLSSGTYLLEAYNEVGCSVMQKVTISGN